MDKVGKELTNKFGSKMIISEYINYRNVKVYFPQYDWYSNYTSYSNVKDGGILCPYEPRICNKGYIGEGKYSKLKHYKIYNEWIAMIHRCYDEKVHQSRPTYIDCEVCNEWLNFQNFAQWYEENYYEVEEEKMHLDKDVLYKGNKIYSPSTCIFVPQRINTLFVKAKNRRGQYPIGVSYHKRDEVLCVRCNIYQNGKTKIVNIKTFPPNEVEQAFQCYKKFKENYIKEVAEEYKNLIPTKLYEAMYKYEVEITD